jgi:hypothetical protein
MIKKIGVLLLQDDLRTPEVLIITPAAPKSRPPVSRRRLHRPVA